MDKLHIEPEHTHGESHVSKEAVDNALEYSGVAIDIADDDKVTPELVKERTCTINNNPRNSDL
ncbi:MAG: hypothetical protein NC043_02555 [Muribaculaceae bacterium]|nr:hypothetical protein [Muribaculaceae bacterium]